MSIFRFSSGTQKLWITSPERATIVTVSSTGMWISFAVRTWWSGYSTSQNHWRPVTWIVITELDAPAAEDVVETVPRVRANSAARTTSGTRTPARPTKMCAPRLRPPGPSAGVAAPRRRTTTTTTSASTTAKTTAEPTSITHQIVAISLDALLAGWSVD